VRGDRRDPPRDRGVLGPGRCAERFGEDDQRQLLLLDRAPPLAVELDGVPVAEAGVRLVLNRTAGTSAADMSSAAILVRSFTLRTPSTSSATAR